MQTHVPGVGRLSLKEKFNIPGLGRLILKEKFIILIREYTVRTLRNPYNVQ